MSADLRGAFPSNRSESFLETTHANEGKAPQHNGTPGSDLPTVASPTTTTLHRSIKMVRCVVSMLLKQLSMGSGTSYLYLSTSPSFSSGVAAILGGGCRPLAGCRRSAA